MYILINIVYYRNSFSFLLFRIFLFFLFFLPHLAFYLSISAHIFSQSYHLMDIILADFHICACACMNWCIEIMLYCLFYRKIAQSTRSSIPFAVELYIYIYVYNLFIYSFIYMNISSMRWILSLSLSLFDPYIETLTYI